MAARQEPEEGAEEEGDKEKETNANEVKQDTNVKTTKVQLFDICLEQYPHASTARPRTSLARAAPENQVMVRDFTANSDVPD